MFNNAKSSISCLFGAILKKCGAKSATIPSVYTSNPALQTRAEHYLPFPNRGASHSDAVLLNATIEAFSVFTERLSATSSGMQRYGPVQCKRRLKDVYYSGNFNNSCLKSKKPLTRPIVKNTLTDI